MVIAMKKTQRIDALRLISSRKMAFLTLCLIIALGLSGFLSTQYSARSMKETLQNFYQEQCFWDLRMISSLGASAEDVEAVRQLPEAADAEGTIGMEGILTSGGVTQTVQIVLRTESVNVPLLLSGELPAGPDECVLPPELLEACGAAVGDIVSLGAPEGALGFPAGEYRVTGTAYHPEYLRRDSGYAVVLAPEAFGQRRFDGIAVLAAGTEELDPFSDAYSDRIAEVKDALVRVSATLRGGLPTAAESSWIVLDRHGNIGYSDYTSTTGTFSSAGIIFGSLFLLVAGLECFSTLGVIVEEEKRSVGVAKAFGFHRSEILFKYLLFGVGAALVGSVAGFAASLGLSRMLLMVLERTGLYVVNATQPVLTAAVTVAVCASMAGICAGSALLSCLDLLRSPAEYLLKGTVLRKQRDPATAKKRSRSGLYFRMILRNMLQDRSRVVLSVVVVAVSCVLIGSGMTVKLAHDGANHRQLSDVLLFDVRVETGNSMDPADRKNLEDRLEALGVEYCPVIWENGLFENEGAIDSTLVIRGDGEQLKTMIGLTDPATGKLTLPDDDGLLLQYRTAENLCLSPGDSLALLDSGLRPRECRISGYVLNYARCMTVMSRTVYDKTYGAGREDNGYLIRLNGVSEEKLREELLSVSDGLQFERADAFFEQYKSIALAYNMVVLVIIAIAVLISFVILIHLANIYMLKKKRELIILRMNGFSIRKTRAYVMYEAVFTTAVGLALGLLAGMPIAGKAVRVMEKAHVQFVRDLQPLAWVIAVAVETLFAVLIYGLAMRKIKQYDINDLSA